MEVVLVTMNAHTPSERLYRIVEEGLCIGCGLCQAVAGADTVKVVKTQSGYLNPVVVGDLDHATVDRIYDTCPGTRVEGLPERLIGTDTKTDHIWGPWRRMVRAWAGDAAMRYEGATGGVLTALADYLLSSGRVAFILHVKASTAYPTFGERHLSFSRADVLSAAGSRYGPAAPLIDIDAVLDRAEPFAIIAKPCDLSALRNYARHDSRVDELVKYWLGLVCGAFMTPKGMDAFFVRHGIDPATVTGVRYRGHGCPGPTRIETSEGVHELHYLDLWSEDASLWTLPFRCKVCPDAIGETADIVAADTWPGGSPRREEMASDAGTNALIVRTEAGAELVQAAASAGALVLENEIGPDELTGYQPHQRDKKYAVWARHEGLRATGRLAPATARLRLAELAAEMPAEFNAAQREGTIRRVREGKASEPTPRPLVPRTPKPRT